MANLRDEFIKEYKADGKAQSVDDTSDKRHLHELSLDEALELVEHTFDPMGLGILLQLELKIRRRQFVIEAIQKKLTNLKANQDFKI